MLVQLTLVADVDPKSTVVAPVVVEKPDPEIDTIVPPAADPAEGKTLVTVGVTVDADAGGTAGIQVSGRGESHPPALAEPGVNLSIYQAPTGRRSARETRCQ